MSRFDDYTRPYAKVADLVKERLVTQLRIPNSTFDVMVDVDVVTNELVMQVKTFMSKAYREPVYKTVSTPATAWDHVKQQYAPAWFKKRFPVRWEKHQFQIQGPTFLCPHLNEYWERNGKEAHLQFMQLAPQINPFKSTLQEAGL
jgi:hypothetical protein